MIGTMVMRLGIVKKFIVVVSGGRSMNRWILTFVLAGVVSLSASATSSARWGAPVSFGEGVLGNPVGVGVDQATGATYVGNLIEGNNDEFDTSHQLVSPPSPFGSGNYSGVAVNPVTSDVYVIDAVGQAVDAFDPSTGALLSSFGVPGTANLLGFFTVVQMASDSAGNVYVPSAPNNEIQVFNANGEAPTGVTETIDGSGANALSAPTGVAVDASKDVWVADTGNGRIEEFSSAGLFLKQIESPGVNAVAVDAHGNVYASVKGSSGPHVVEYDSAGAQVQDFGLGLLGESALETPNTIAVDDSNETLYVADGGKNLIWAFVPSPEVVTGQATQIRQTSVTLSGHLDPAGSGDIESCEFEYGMTDSYGQKAPCEPPAPYSGSQDVSVQISGLTPGTNYHYRVVAANSRGSEVGEDKVFSTFGPASVSEETSFDASISTARLRAQVDPFGFETSCRVQYVTDASFAASGYDGAEAVPCSPENLGADFESHQVDAELTGLAISTTYHYRFVLENQAGRTEGPDQTFATFGVSAFSFGVSNQAGSAFTQAGGHPFELRADFSLNKSMNESGSVVTADANPRTVRVELPPGLIGNPEATIKCKPYNAAHADCSGASQVGVLTIFTTKAPGGLVSPIYNLMPPKGVAAQFGARFNGFTTAHIDARVRTGGDYGITSDSLYVSAGEGVQGVSVRLWGVPADPIHDPERYCPAVGKVNEEGPCPSGAPLVPFLTTSTACLGPQSAVAQLDSWQAPEVFVSAVSEMPALTGCNKLTFTPTIQVRPESGTADSPTGMEVDLHVPQNTNPVGLAEPNLKDAVVALPAGLSINPSSANGLEACSPAQIELNGPAPARCPDASKIGSVEVVTPLLDHPIKGGVYVATQEDNPFHSLFAIYIAVDDEQSGVVLKLAGKVTPDPATGQLTTSFTENPQLPFQELKLVFFGGARSALATPQTCGTFNSSSSLTPWSAPESGPAATSSSPFAIGSGCSSGFSPSVSAGTVSNHAGGFSPFTLTITRKDGERDLSGTTVTMPPGLAALIAKVPVLCHEEQAQAGTCPEASRIGTTNTAAGAGPQPFWLSGPVYLTESYKGAPFGLSIVVPAVAGPFNLGTVVVRAAISVDPHTAQVTVTSDPLPQIRDGVPFRLKTVNVTVDRPEFIFNPTNCSQFSVNTLISGHYLDGSGATTVPVSSPFAASGCGELPFKPVFKVSTNAHHTRKNGASLHVVVQSSKGQSNIREVKVELPKILPSRLSTLKLACTEKVFAADPASCPPGSRVGSATAHTPVLPVPLSGPVYFVSHGGAKFPELVVVLQGDGVTVQLAGETFISGKGVTRSTFKTVPDVPITRFDLTLPTGPHSALAATGNLCKGKLIMPTTIKGQNGTVIKQSTKVAVSGCPKAKKTKKGGKSKKHKKK